MNPVYLILRNVNPRLTIRRKFADYNCALVFLRQIDDWNNIREVRIECDI